MCGSRPYPGATRQVVGNKHLSFLSHSLPMQPHGVRDSSLAAALFQAADVIAVSGRRRCRGPVTVAGGGGHGPLVGRRNLGK